MPADRILTDSIILDDDTNPVGSGGFADVYAGICKSGASTQRVAVKVIRSPHQEASKLLPREVNVWRRLHHPNVLCLLGVCFLPRSSKLPSLVCPWMANADILTYLRDLRPPPNISTKLRLLCDALQGLEYLHLHSPQIVHGDVKGSNILISDDHKALLCDFGISSIADDLLFCTSTVRGTPNWMSPELHMQQTPTTSSDIWAFGATIVQVLSDRAPYHEARRCEWLWGQIVVRKQLPTRPEVVSDLVWGLVE